MTRSEVRLQELAARPHLWPEELAEAVALAQELGVKIVIRRESLDSWEPEPQAEPSQC